MLLVSVMSRTPRGVFLVCGIVAPILYVAMTLFVGLLWEGYSLTSHTPSELSAIGAPTRTLWVLLGNVYTVLMIAFGWSLGRTAAHNRAVRAVGVLLMTQAVFGYFWPPMHQRAVLAAGGGTLTDTLHLVWAMVTGIFFMLAMGFGAAAFGKRFRIYSIATMVIVFACGAWTATYASRVQANLPTPGIGVWERINIAAFMLWVAVLAIAVLRVPNVAATTMHRDALGPHPHGRRHLPFKSRRTMSQPSAFTTAEGQARTDGEPPALHTQQASNGIDSRAS